MQVNGNTITIDRTLKPSSQQEIITTLNQILKDYSFASVKISSFAITSDLAQILIDKNVVVSAKNERLRQLLKDLGIRVTVF